MTDEDAATCLAGCAAAAAVAARCLLGYALLFGLTAAAGGGGLWALYWLYVIVDVAWNVFRGVVTVMKS